MHPQSLVQHQDQTLDHDNNKKNDQNTLNITHPCHALADLDQDEHDSFNCTDNPPESYAVCRSKVADWLYHNTFIERNASVKLSSKPQDPCSHTTSSRRSVCITAQRPKLSIIGFRKKPVHQTDGKTKHTDKVENVRLFRNRSEPGKDYCLLITEPVSPRVSCVGRVGSMRVVEPRKGGVWRSFKAVFSNLIYTNRVTKVAS